MKEKPDKIIFTGGGSGGHLFPAIALIDELKKRELKLSIEYIGSQTGPEATVIKEKGITYHQIKTGKLRRYLSLQNFLDIFKLTLGIFQAINILYKLKRSSNNCLLFSTGGFVSVPPVLGAKLLGIPIILHEQTSRLGLANKIAAIFASQIFISFESTAKFLPKDKVELSGNPIRKEIFEPLPPTLIINKLSIIPRDKKLLFVTGGGNGSKLINDSVYKSLEKLEEQFLIVHQVGKDHIEEAMKRRSDSYLPLSFTDQMSNLLKSADIIVSRAGAGTVAELMALNRRSIFIPLKIAQKNEQYHNAVEAKKIVGSLIIEEEQFKNTTLVDIIDDFIKDLKEHKQTSTFNFNNKAVDILITAICKYFNYRDS